MDSEPVSPRTRSPSLSLSLSDHDLLRPSPSPPDLDDEHTAPARDHDQTCCEGHAATPSKDATSRPPNAQDKAKRPLRLLDLPVDILKDIIHQLPHTNDLTSLSLCHSALHRLTIPCIYSRFDIVWPDESTHAEPRSGVDALTYGLATLVMGDDCFPHQNRLRHQHPAVPGASKAAATPYPITRRRFGNYYAQFTKKFSLGNGPTAWVKEYMITKEGGKMLGTLVALAIARMVNLETFVWDMPTGVLRDVWLALSSLADRTDGEDCRLERLWIRWHDNSMDTPLPPPAPPMILNNVNVPPPPNTGHPSGIAAAQPSIALPQHFHTPVTSAIDRVEHPTFSVIPPLKSLSVLDIDELPYLDELSILIARSQTKLRELRIGIAPQAQQRDWVTAWEGDGIQQVDYEATWTGASAIGEKRLGGVLGILVGRVHNLRHSDEQPAQQLKSAGINVRSLGSLFKAGLTGAVPAPMIPLTDREPDNTTDHFGHPLDEPEIPEGVSIVDEMQALDINLPESLFDGLQKDSSVPLREPSPPSIRGHDGHDGADGISEQDKLIGKLKLEVLELERVPLSVPVLLKAFDWSMLTTLTLLNCSNHEQLWKSLRRTYTPRPPYPNGSPSSSKAYKASYTLRSEYSLNLKKIHTNTVSPSLISFLKETLAPNSLEVLFLQEGRPYQSTVTIDAIYRGPLRRHRASLRKLMIDSSEIGQDDSPRWRRWMLNRDILSFITSGRMNSLRELAVSVDYKDWHHFLQRLPRIPHIRSLYIPYIADHPHGNNIDPRELAYQILDIVHLFPEIELCYMGLLLKCFEILENRPSNYDLRHDGINVGDGAGTGYTVHDSMLSDDESEATEDEEDEDMDGMGEDEESEVESEDVQEDLSDDESWAGEEKRPKLRVREILFYEERVEAFRRRHGVLRP